MTNTPKATRRHHSVPLAAPVTAIVGIGASAGGLEALGQFFKSVPADCGLTFVVVPHLHPTHKCIMAELLQRDTAMPVVLVRDRMRVAPGHVYVIPPGRDLSIFRSVLHLLKPATPRGVRLPIDFFLRSLADDQQERSIVVILSGMGSDGTLGLQAVKERAGAVFVQRPDTAGFDGMPRSAIATGMADVIAPAEELPARIIAYLRHRPHLHYRPVTPGPDLNDASGLEKVILLLRTLARHDFSEYKKSTLYRRVERRMGLHQLTRISDYVHFLRENPHEGDLLFKELLIGVTSFFRDPLVWEQLRKVAIPALLEGRPAGSMLRAWIPGCSTGEEAYTLAMCFREAIDKLKSGTRYSLQIFATDLDKAAIDRARNGTFPANITADVSEERLRRFFVREQHGYRIGKEIREMIIFAPQNLIADPPFTKLDLVSCRNLLIYLEPTLQKRVLALFHFSLNRNGVLILGGSETAGPAGELFTPLPGKARLYRRQDKAPRAGVLDFYMPAFSPASAQSSPSSTMAKAAIPNLQALTDGLLLQLCAPAAVLTTDQGDILYVSGKTGKYLEPAAGKANLNLFAMARPGLGGAINEAFGKVLRSKGTMAVRNLTLEDGGGNLTVDLTVQLLASPPALHGLILVVFTDRPKPAEEKSAGRRSGTKEQTVRAASLVQELRRARQELLAARDDMQTSQEELKSANEELQSTNEELQSTNEELTTSKEEMQSMNEELQTVNQELQAKVDELSRSSDDMKNLLNSTEIATLFLDEQLRVRRFTTQTASIIKLIPGDAGRPITDLVSDLDYPRLAEDAREVLQTLGSRERLVSARDGRWFSVRVKPYRTQDNRIDGVVMTFLDVSRSAVLEFTLREATEMLRGRAAGAGPVKPAAEPLEGFLKKADAALRSAAVLAAPDLGGKRKKSRSAMP